MDNLAGNQLATAIQDIAEGLNATRDGEVNVADGLFAIAASLDRLTHIIGEVFASEKAITTVEHRVTADGRIISPRQDRRED